MKLKKMLTGHLLVLALAFPNAVLAKEFTFAGNIVLSEMHPDVTTARILCAVKKEANSDASVDINIGSGTQDFDVPASGELNGKFKITFDVNPGEDPVDVNRFKCTLRVSKDKTNFAVPISLQSSICDNPDQEIIFRCKKEGATSRTSTVGPIP
jgi:hypothetical protein